MSQDHNAQLVRMVNQIAINLGSGRDAAEAVESVCAHLEKFWARSMKRSLIACLERDNTELTPLARCAVQRLKKELCLKPPAKLGPGATP